VLLLRNMSYIFIQEYRN